MSESGPLYIAVVGDIHGCWGDADVAWFNDSAVDLVLLVGDLAGYRQSGSLKVARSLSRLRPPTLWIPGNHDSAHPLQLLGEMLENDVLVRGFHKGQDQRMAELREAISPVRACGYSLHPIPGADIEVLAARPHSMGGPRLGFRPYLDRSHGIPSLEASAKRLKELVELSRASSLIVLAHNGPAGMGSGRGDLWGCDFRPVEEDFGDPDLREALVYASSIGKNVLAVVAGHMHRALKGGGERRAFLDRDGTVYVNAAEVPRIRRDRETGCRRRHHVALHIDEGRCDVRDVWVDSEESPTISDTGH